MWKLTRWIKWRQRHGYWYLCASTLYAARNARDGRISYFTNIIIWHLRAFRLVLWVSSLKCTKRAKCRTIDRPLFSVYSMCGVCSVRAHVRCILNLDYAQRKRWNDSLRIVQFCWWRGVAVAMFGLLIARPKHSNTFPLSKFRTRNRFIGPAPAERNRNPREITTEHLTSSSHFKISQCTRAPATVSITRILSSPFHTFRLRIDVDCWNCQKRRREWRG